MSEIKKDKNDEFVSHIVSLCKSSNGARAEIKRAENKTSQHRAWKYLARFVDLEKEWQLNFYCVIASAIAAHKVTSNGTVGLGRALSLAFGNDPESEPAQARLRRLLSCNSSDELCQVLPRLLRIIYSREVRSIDLADTLRDIVRFHFRPDQIKAKWANQFYGYAGDLA